MEMSELRPVESVRVVIADDHPFYRRGLGRLLRKCGIVVVGEAPNGEAAIVAAQEAAPDVVIMDLNMPGLSGAEATRRLLDRAPKSRVLVLSATAQDSDVTEAFFVGASGYLTKDLPVDELVEGIRAAAAHRAVVSPHTARVLLGRVRNAIFGDEFAPSTRLSGRELAVLGHRADGKTEREIAETLAISLGAVRDHAAEIVTKLHVEGGAAPAMSARGSPGA